MAYSGIPHVYGGGAHELKKKRGLHVTNCEVEVEVTQHHCHPEKKD